jgi:hypothetical protein
MVEQHEEKQRVRKSKLKAVLKSATDAMKSDTGIVRAADVKDKVKEEQGINVTSVYVRQVLRADMGLRYR